MEVVGWCPCALWYSFFTCPVDPGSKHLLSISSNGNVLVLSFIYNSRIMFWFYIQRRNLRHEFKNRVLVRPVDSCSILAVEGMCQYLLLQSQWKTAFIRIVTVNYYYLLLETPGSVITSKKNQRSLIVMFLNGSFSQNLYIINFTNSLHSLHTSGFYTITVFEWFWRVLSWTKFQVNYRTALYTNRNLSTPDNFKNYSPLPLTRNLWFKPGKTRLTLYDKQISVINPLVINQVPKVAQLARTLRVCISE